MPTPRERTLFMAGMSGFERDCRALEREAATLFRARRTGPLDRVIGALRSLFVR